MPAPVKLSQHSWTLKPDGHRLNLIVRGPVCEREAGLYDKDCREMVLRALGSEGQVDLITLQGTTWRQYEGLPVKVMNHLLVLTKELERLKNSQVPLPDIQGWVIPDADLESAVQKLRQEADHLGSEEAPEGEEEGPHEGAGSPGSLPAPQRLEWVEKNRGMLRQELAKLDCPRCAFYPPFIFERLSGQLQGGLEVFPTEVAKLADAIAQGKKNLQSSEARFCDRCLGTSGAEVENLGAKLDEFVQTVAAVGSSGGRSVRAGR